MTVSESLAVEVSSDEDPGALDAVGVVSASLSFSPSSPCTTCWMEMGAGAVVSERARARRVAKPLEASAPREVTSWLASRYTDPP